MVELVHETETPLLVDKPKRGFRWLLGRFRLRYGVYQSVPTTQLSITTKLKRSMWSSSYRSDEKNRHRKNET